MDGKIYLIGLAPDLAWLPPAAADIIARADVLAGGQRLLDLFADREGQEKIKLTTPLSDWLKALENIRAAGRDAAVLTSGDPNFFGLGKALFKHVTPDFVTVIPSPTIIQQAFARLRISWEGVEVVSLHGRQGLREFWGAVYRAGHMTTGSGHVAVYTDGQNSPDVIAKKLLGRGQQNWRMTVLENLGEADERISSWSLFEAKTQKFSELNLVVLECRKRPTPIYIGMPEDLYMHEAGLITKKEIRAVTLALLELKSHHTLWDLGSGSGSVSIEAASILHHGLVWAVEKSPLRAEQIAANRAYFGAAQVELVEDDSLAAIEHLPPPDRIFIGGGGRDLAAIITAAAEKLLPGGLMAVNAVNLGALNQATSAMSEAGLKVNVTQTQAARSEPLGSSLYFKPINQVWSVVGRKNED